MSKHFQIHILHFSAKYSNSMQQIAFVVELELIQQQKWMVVDPVIQYQKLYLQLYQLLMMGVSTRNMYSCLQKCNKLNKSHLVGKLLNSIVCFITFSLDLILHFRGVPPPRNSEGPPKSRQTQPDCENC